MLESGFVRGSEKWKAETVDGRRANLMYNTFSQGLEVVAQSADPLYFVASGNCCIITSIYYVLVLQQQ